MIRTLLFAVVVHSFVSVVFAETLEVRLKNIVTGQIMTPPLIAVGACISAALVVGNPASSNIEKLAEGGLTADLAQWFRSKGWTIAPASPAIYPGQWSTVSFVVPVITPPSNLCLFVGGMLTPTNDGFYAIQSLRIRSNLARTIYVPAYDSGTEFNSEACSDMPAPDACGKSGVGYSPEKSPLEGHITFHRGIHGYERSELDPRVNDFDSRTVAILYMLLR